MTEKFDTTPYWVMIGVVAFVFIGTGIILLLEALYLGGDTYKDFGQTPAWWVVIIGLGISLIWGCVGLIRARIKGH